MRLTHELFQLPCLQTLPLSQEMCNMLARRFPALGIRCLFSRAWYRILVFPRLALVVCFPALGTGCLFSCAWYRVLVFPRLSPVAYFPALLVLIGSLRLTSSKVITGTAVLEGAFFWVYSGYSYFGLGITEYTKSQFQLKERSFILKTEYSWWS